MRVLVVEDFEVLARSIGTGLRREGMAVDVVLDGTDALGHLAVTRYDVVVLDRDLPGVHGDDICRTIVAEELGQPGADADRRQHGQGPGRRPRARRRRLPAQAVRLLRARRPGPRARAPLDPGGPPTLEAGDLSLDPTRRVAFRAGRRLDLSPKEFAVLECLLASGDRVVSAEELLERVWDEAADPFTTAVKTTMRRLRAKLGDPPLIETVREGGYRIGDSTMSIRQSPDGQLAAPATAACAADRALQRAVRRVSSSPCSVSPASCSAAALVPPHAERLPGRRRPRRHGRQFDVGPAIVGLIAAVVAVWLAWWLAGRFLRPLRAMNDHRPGDLRHQPASPPRSRRPRRRAHRARPNARRPLRTPRSVVRVPAPFRGQRLTRAADPTRRPAHAAPGGARRPRRQRRDLRAACEEALQLGEQQERLIDALLTLATSERGVEHWEPFDLARDHRHACSPAAAKKPSAEASTSTPASSPAPATRRPQTGREPGGQPHRQRATPQHRRRKQSRSRRSPAPGERPSQ